MKYSYSDDEDDGSDFSGVRRSTRNSGISTPAETGPTITASGRQVKSRVGGMYGETILVDQRKEIENERVAATDANQESSSDIQAANGRFRKSRQLETRRPAQGRYEELGSDEESEEAASEGAWSGNEDEADDSEPEFDEGLDEDEDMSANSDSEGDDMDEDENTQESLVVQLRYKKEGVKQEPGSRKTLDNSSQENSLSQVPSATNGDHESATVHAKEDVVVNHGHSNTGVSVMHSGGSGGGMLASPFNALQPVQ